MPGFNRVSEAKIEQNRKAFLQMAEKLIKDLKPSQDTILSKLEKKLGPRKGKEKVKVERFGMLARASS